MDAGRKDRAYTYVEVVDPASQPDPLQPSIYDWVPSGRRYLILLLAALVSLLGPFSDTMYLPALAKLTADFNTTSTLGAVSVAVYMLAVGALCLVWGPFSDRYGRRLTYYCCAFIYLASTIVCIFAPTIQVLIAARTVQGCGVTGFMSSGNGVVADIFPPHQRGRAGGAFMVPVLVGPIIGPVIGGAMSQSLGWRSNFVLLAVHAGLAVPALLLVLRQETHQYYALQHIRAREGEAKAASIKEAASITKPVFRLPWQPMRLILEYQVAPYVAPALIQFASMFATIMTLPVRLAAPPYSLSPGLIGLAYLAVGCGGFLGSLLGGFLADTSAKRFSSGVQGRLLCSGCLSVSILPAALVTYGWTFSFNTHLAGPLVAQFFVGFGMSCYLPAVYSYLSITKQQQAGAAAAAMQCLMFLLSGVFILISVPVMHAIGLGPFCSILAGAVVTIMCIAVTCMLRALRQPPAEGTPAPPDAFHAASDTSQADSWRP